MTKARKLEIIKYILGNYPESCLYHNYVLNVGGNSRGAFPQDKWDNLVDLTNEEDYMDEISMEEIKDFFLHELMKVCGCGNAFRMIVLTVRVLEEIDLTGFPDKLGVTIPTSYDTEVSDADFKLAFIYMLDGLKLTQHGFSISNMKLTELGRMVLEVFQEALKENLQ